MPSMDSMTGPVGVGRDRDHHQGVAEETAPGMEVAVTMAQTEEEYSGYDLEVKIPFDILPDSIDPAHMGFNVLINDSDTQNQTAQVRVGWRSEERRVGKECRSRVTGYEAKKNAKKAMRQTNMEHI